jgi:hypothetical protein
MDTLLAAGRQRRPAAVCGHSIEVAIATLNQTSRGSRTIKCGRLKRSWIKTRLTIATGRQEPYRAPRQDNKPRAALLHCHASLGENVQVGHGNWQIADRKQRCRRWMGRCTTRHRQSICRRIDSDRGAATGPKVDVFHFRTEERHRRIPANASQPVVLCPKETDGVAAEMPPRQDAPGLPTNGPQLKDLISPRNCDCPAAPPTYNPSSSAAPATSGANPTRTTNRIDNEQRKCAQSGDLRFIKISAACSELPNVGG